MKIDNSLVKEMFKSGMGWTEIKNSLVKMNPDYTAVSISALRDICRKEMRETEEKPAEAIEAGGDKFESISVLGRQVKINRRHKNNGVPIEVQDKIQENNLMIAEACATCGFKPSPGHACALPAGMCKLGHYHKLDFDPVALMVETKQLMDQYKKPVEPIEQPIAVKERPKTENLFEKDTEPSAVAAKKRPKKNASSTTTIEELEDTVQSADEEFAPENLIGAALENAGEKDGHKIEEIDAFAASDLEIDDSELDNIDMSIPKDADIDEDIHAEDNINEEKKPGILGD